MNAKHQLAQALGKVFSKPITGKISISRLVKLAKINRTTFYRNFATIEELIRWFILRDLIFRYEGSKPFNFEYAFAKVFNYIDAYYDFFHNLFNSIYLPSVIAFIKKEIFSYQMSNFNSIDLLNIISQDERIAYCHFYSSGIAALFQEYILNNNFRKNRQSYITYSLRIVKNYIERAIELTRSKRYE
jgi:AcrR family transcriptional regulator